MDARRAIPFGPACTPIPGRARVLELPTPAESNRRENREPRLCTPHELQRAGGIANAEHIVTEDVRVVRQVDHFREQAKLTFFCLSAPRNSHVHPLIKRKTTAV